MSRLFSRIGPWLFVLAIVWYLTGNFLLDRMHKENLANAQSHHTDEQHFNISALKNVSISATDTTRNYGTIKVIFDPTASQATIRNKNLELSVTGEVANGVFNITFGRIVGRQYGRLDQVEIHLPPLVNNITFAEINAFELSGSLPNPAADLTLDIVDCKPTVNIDHLTVNQLKLATTCKALENRRCCTAGFEMGKDVVVNMLNVAMAQGNFKFSSDVIPHRTLLDIGDGVEVTGRREFLKTAEFGKPQ